MGLAWQQGPLAPGAVGAFLVPEPLPARLLYAKPLRRRVRLMFGGQSIAESDDAVLNTSPGATPSRTFRRTRYGWVAWSRWKSGPVIETWVRRPGSRCRAGGRAGRGEPGSTRRFHHLLGCSRTASRSRGGRWTAFMKRRSSHADPADLVAKIQDPSLAQPECLGLNARRRVRNAVRDPSHSAV